VIVILIYRCHKLTDSFNLLDLKLVSYQARTNLLSFKSKTGQCIFRLYICIYYLEVFPRVFGVAVGLWRFWDRISAVKLYVTISFTWFSLGPSCKFLDISIRRQLVSFRKFWTLIRLSCHCTLCNLATDSHEINHNKPLAVFPRPLLWRLHEFMNIEVKMEAGSKDYCINSHETSLEKNNGFRIPTLNL
jgi:hypothetical protein